MAKAAKTVELPNDIESLKRLVIAQQALLLSREVEIEKLKIELAQLKRLRVRSLEREAGCADRAARACARGTRGERSGARAAEARLSRDDGSARRTGSSFAS